MRRIPQLPRLTKGMAKVILIVVLAAIVLCLLAAVVIRIGSGVKTRAFVAEMTATKAAYEMQVTATSMPTNTEMPEPTATATNTPTPTVTATAQFVESMLYTATPQPTLTSTVGPSPVPEKVIVLQEFANGLGEWKAVDPDAVNIVNGSFYGTWLVFELPDDVKNFQIEIEGNASGTGTGVGIYVSPAFVSADNNLNFRTNWRDREWRYCDGGCEELSGQMRGAQDAKMTIVVTVVDQNVQISINGVEVASVFNNKIETVTKVAIGAFGAGSSIKSVKIVQLP